MSCANGEWLKLGSPPLSQWMWLLYLLDLIVIVILKQVPCLCIISTS